MILNDHSIAHPAGLLNLVQIYIMYMRTKMDHYLLLLIYHDI